MYLLYNREYELVSEAKTFSQVKEIIGEDIVEQDVNSLRFIRGKTVITEENLKRLVHEIVAVEKAEVVEYITEEVESQEDETVELKTSNRHLQNKLLESNEYLSEISRKIGKALEETNELTDLDSVGDAKSADFSEKNPKSTQVKGKSSVNAIWEDGVEDEESGVTDLDDETKNILSHIEKNHQSPTRSKVKSVSKVVPNRRKQTPTEINFISIIDGGKVSQIRELKGKTLIKTTKLAQDVGLDREHVEFLIENVLRECGGTPKYQNKNVVSPAEAVWVIVSALTKRDGFGNSQRFQKTKENAEDFYQSWEQQKEEINSKLN